MGQATSRTRSDRRGGLPPTPETPGLVPPAPVGSSVTVPGPQVIGASAEATGSTTLPPVTVQGPTLVSSQPKPSKGSKRADDTESPILWTQSYQPEGTDEGLWDSPTPDTDEDEIEKDTHVKLEELIERTVSEFKTRGELFERCGYDLATILEAVEAGVQEYKQREQEWEERNPFWQHSGRTPAVGPPAPLSTFSVGQSQEGDGASTQAQGFSTSAVTEASVPDLAGVPTGNEEEEEGMPDDEEWASRILSAPYFPGDLMGDLEEFTETPLETYEKLWTRQAEGIDEFIDYMIESVVSEGPSFVFDDTESEASDTEDGSNGDTEEDMSTDGSEADADEEEEEEYEDDEEEKDEMEGLERLDDEEYARLIGSVRKVPPVAYGASAGQTAHTPSLAQGGPQSMSVDAAMDEVSTSATDEGAMAEAGPSAVTAAFASESPTSLHSQSSKSSADQTPTPPGPASAAPSPSSGQKRTREEEVEGQQDKVRRAMLGVQPRRYIDSDSDSEEEERRLDPREAAKHVRHKVEVLKLIMGPTRNLDKKALRQLQAELRLLTQCDTWLDSLESEAGPSGGGHESRMLLDCLDLAIRDVSLLRRLDVDQAVYRAEEVLTEREIAEEETDEAMEEPALDRIKFKSLVQQLSQGYRTDMPIQPEAFAIMQEACEAYATKLFKTANRMAKLQGRDHLKAGDLTFIQSLDHQLWHS